MGIASNAMILKSLRENLSNVLTESTLTMVLNSVSDILLNYEIHQSANASPGEEVLLDAFLEALSVEGRSKKTIDRYKYIITNFLQACGTVSQSVTVYHVRKWLSDEKARGLSDSTINGARMVLSAYFGWLHRDSLIDKNPMANIGAIKCQKKVKEIYSEIDLEKLRTSCPNLRDKAILYFLNSTGCRISEVTGLNIADIDFQKQECVVLGKGNKQRTVYFDDVTAMVLKEYIDQRKDDSPALFVGKGSDRMTPGGVRAMLNRLSEASGVDHVHPHKFRRTNITHLVAHGMPIELVKELAGHAKIDTTMGYVVTNASTVKNAYERYF